MGIIALTGNILRHIHSTCNLDKEILSYYEI
jgi:hypothetical protein